MVVVLPKELFSYFQFLRGLQLYLPPETPKLFQLEVLLHAILSYGLKVAHSLYCHV